MDPDATLTRIREIITTYDLSTYDQRELANELVDLITGLDTWLTHGGFLPESWWAKEYDEY